MKKILVTGAAGFLGSHLTDALLAQSSANSVLGVDNLSTGNLANLAHLDSNPFFTFLNHDITLPFDPGPVDFIFNFASPASPVDYARLGPETLLAGSVGPINALNPPVDARGGVRPKVQADTAEHAGLAGSEGLSKRAHED